MLSLMKRILVLLLVAAGTLLLASSEDEVKAAINKFSAAVISKDRATLEKLVAEEVTYSHSSAMMENKKQMIDAMLSPDMKYESLDMEGTTYRIYGNTALVQTKMTVKNVQKGERKTLPLSVLMVWTKKNGNWQLVARQSTRYAN